MSAIAWSDPGYEALIQLLGARTGLTFSSNRQTFAESGIRRAMAKAGIGRASLYLEALLASRFPIDDLVDELTVGETYFFREPDRLDYLRYEILAEIRRRRGPDHVLRLWSAGCASGEEPFSLAILLDAEGLSGRSRVTATDISRAALARARASLYTPRSFRSDHQSIVPLYFRQTGKRLAPIDRLRSCVRFEQLNLAADDHPHAVPGTSEVDVILCRNVLIYFDRDTVRRVAMRLFAALSSGGWLITGASDPLLSDYAPFETVQTPAGLIYRRLEAAPARVPPRRPATVIPPAAPVFVAATIEVPPKPSHTVVKRDLVAEVHNALRRGDYLGAQRLTDGCEDRVDLCLLRIRALANAADPLGAERVAVQAAARHPLSPDLQFLHAILLIDRERLPEAAQALKRVIYLDGTLAAAHVVLGSVLHRLGRISEARRAYRNGYELAALAHADETVPLAEGESAGQLAAAAAAAELALLGSPEGRIG